MRLRRSRTMNAMNAMNARERDGFTQTLGQTVVCSKASGWINRDFLPRVRVPLVLHDARDKGEEREVAARSDVFPGMDGRTNLPNEDGASGNGGAGVDFHAALLGIRVTTVA